MKKIIALLLSLTMTAAFTACGEERQTENTQAETTQEQTEETIEKSSEEQTGESDNSDKIASADETITPDEVGYEGMTAVYADSLNDGIYEISVDSSSSMFKIAECRLNVNGGEMTADLIINSTSYTWLFKGTAEEAVNSDESDYISYEENEEGQSVFSVPVEALDYIIDCASFSRKKEKWYDRQLVFRADSLPDEAFKEGALNKGTEIELAEGDYNVEVTLEGGSGKASVSSPANLHVADGEIIAEIIWSSSNYDYMVVDGEKYLPEIIDGHSVFEIPVTEFDCKMPVLADTTAMSVPYEIEYTLYFDSSTITEI